MANQQIQQKQKQQLSNNEIDLLGFDNNDNNDDDDEFDEFQNAEVDDNLEDVFGEQQQSVVEQKNLQNISDNLYKLNHLY